MGEVEKAMERYRQHFGEDFHIYWPPRPAEELLQQIDDCIQADTPQPEPEYQEGVDY